MMRGLEIPENPSLFGTKVGGATNAKVHQSIAADWRSLRQISEHDAAHFHRQFFSSDSVGPQSPYITSSSSIALAVVEV